MPEIGSPRESDAVARAERVANSAMTRAIAIGKSVRERYTREFGSTKQRPADELRQYLTVRDDPDMSDRFLQMLETKHGPERGQIMYVQWVQANEERLNGA